MESQINQTTTTKTITINSTINSISTLQKLILEGLKPETIEKRKKIAEENAKHEKHLQQQMAHKLITESNMPKRYINKTVLDYIISNENKQAQIVLDNYTDNYFIYGECGTGKTFLATLLMRSLALEGIASHFTTTSTLFYNLNPFQSETSESKRTRQFYQNIKCLVIDDIGVEKPSQFTNSVLFDIINHRYNEELQTVFTSNFDIVKLQKRWGDYEGLRIGRRITEMCKPIFLKKV